MDILEDAGFGALDADEPIAVLQSHDKVAFLFSDIDVPGGTG